MPFVRAGVQAPGRQHDLVDDEVAAGRDHRDGARAGRFDGDCFRPAKHFCAGGRRPVGHGAREQCWVHVPVVRKEEGAGDLAAQAREAGAYVGGAEHVRAHAESARHLGLICRFVHGRRRLVGLDDAVVVVVPALAAVAGELVMQVGARRMQGVQHGRRGPRSRGRRAGAVEPEPAQEGAAGARGDVEGARAVEHPAQPLAEGTGRGQGRDVARHEQAAVGVRPTDRRADLGLLLDERDRRSVRGQSLGGAGPYGSAAHHQDVAARAHVLSLCRRSRGRRRPAAKLTGRASTFACGPYANEVLTSGR